MKKTPKRKKKAADIQPEYDFTGGMRGKYAKRYAGGTNVVLLEPDVARAFRTAKAVNRALRELLTEQPSPG